MDNSARFPTSRGFIRFLEEREISYRDYSNMPCDEQRILENEYNPERKPHGRGASTKDSQPHKEIEARLDDALSNSTTTILKNP